MKIRQEKFLAGFAAVCSITLLTDAATDPALLQEDFPFQDACISAPFPPGNVAMKGIAIRIGNGASMLFDTELLRMAAGWTGQFITTFGVAFDGHHGGHPSIDGEQKFGTKPVPGWAGPAEAFSDPRPEPFGPLPREWAHWNGLYLAGTNVVLSYSIHGAQVQEWPSSVRSGEQSGFVRTIRMAATESPLTMLICDVDAGTGRADGNSAFLTAADGRVTQAGEAGIPAGAKFDVSGNRIVLRLPRLSSPALFKIVIWSGAQIDAPSFSRLLEGAPSFPAFEKGGPAHWPQAVITKGTLQTSKTPDGAYVSDSLAPPFPNPWKRRVRFGGLDFFKDGTRAALCTWDGDIWIVSGIDDGLQKLTWKRFASGMYETLGLKIVDDVIYTSGRDQITRHHDLNGDGEADFYENFNNDFTSSEGFHEFVFDLQTDPDRNFYFSKAGPVRAGGHLFEHISANAGTMMKVSKDGSKLEIVATGFRAPNGIGVGPKGQITSCDNEGTWVPACPIYWIRPGGFYGVEQTAHAQPIPEFNKPLCWLSHDGWDNSGGGQAWVASGRWGPFEGELLHTSYGQCALYLVMQQDLGGRMQGGVVRIPVRFTSTAMRPRFNPRDGQLYVAGLGGWQTTAVRPAGLDRIRYTGKPVYSVKSLAVDKRGIHLGFTQPLDEKEAVDPQNYSAQRWNYERAEHYGSPEFSVANPRKKERDNVEITGAKLSADHKSVTLTIADLKPVMQMQIKFSLKAADGTPIEQAVQHTIHEVPERAETGH